jgi:hypothetical protein
MLQEQDPAALRQRISAGYAARVGGGGEATPRALADAYRGHKHAGIGGDVKTMKAGLTGEAPVRGQFIVVLEHISPGWGKELLPLYGPGTKGGRGFTVEALRRELDRVREQCELCSMVQPRAVDTGTRGVLVVVFATSGVALTTCLSRASAGAVRRHIVSVESFLLADPRLRDALRTGDEPVMKAALKLPFPQLCALWRDAMEQAGAKAKDLLATGDVFLTLHGVYWGKGEDSYGFLSCLDLRALNAAAHAAEASRILVLMLLDDVWRTVGRLSVGARPLFDERDSVSAAASAIVAWRRQEFIVADYVARLLTSQPTAITFGVQHPLATFERLLTRPLDELVYLSYGVPGPADVAARTIHQSRINEMAAEIRSRDVVTVVEAGAVDEHRQPRRQSLHAGTLRQRWPLPNDVPMLVGPEPDIEAFADQPFKRVLGTPFPKGRETEGTLSRVRDLLYASVYGRGRSLVVQAEGGVIGLRPFYRDGGFGSLGMQIVARLNEDLCALSGPNGRRRQTVMWHLPEDEKRRVVHLIAEVCHIHLSPTAGEPLVRGWSARSKEALERWLTTHKEGDALARIAVDSKAEASEVGRKAGEALVASAAALGRAGEFSDGELADIAASRVALGTALRHELNDDDDPGDEHHITRRAAFGVVRWVVHDKDPARLVDRILEIPMPRRRSTPARGPDHR